MSFRATNQQLLRRALLCLILGIVAKAPAEHYEVDGELEQTLFRLNGDVQLVRRSQFTVFVRGAAWLIQTADHDEGRKPLLLRETACVNGAEVYEVSTITNHSTRPWNMGSVVSNNVPVGQADDYFVCHLWLMFASGCYFKDLTTNWLTPVYDLNASVAVDPKLKRPAKWELINGPGSLPSSVGFWRNAWETDATYGATGVTNAGGVQIPSGFVFEQRVGAGFAPGASQAGDSPATYRVRKRAVATVTAVRATCSRSDLLPEAKGPTVVFDERQAPAVTQTASSTYDIRDGVRWVSVEEAKKLPKLGAVPPVQKPSRLITAVLCASLLLPIAGMFFFRRGKKAEDGQHR